MEKPPISNCLAPDGDTLHIHLDAADSSLAMTIGSIRAMLQWLGGQSKEAVHIEYLRRKTD